ncbi:MAG: DUF4277 domain-containing protein [Desulfobacterium sp.]|nr:DUF4277 domain-containing protein [Desulfobacterium sp.]
MYKDISLATKQLGVMPMVKHYISELKLHHIFGKHIPMKPNEKLEPAQGLSMMLLNLVCASRPLYRVYEWLTDYTDGIAEKDIYAAQYNDDRLGRNLDKLFAAEPFGFLSVQRKNKTKKAPFHFMWVKLLMCRKSSWLNIMVFSANRL